MVHGARRQPGRTDHASRRRHGIRRGDPRRGEPAVHRARAHGNLWFTERTGNRIGRITPVGVVTEFESGISAGSHPYGIAGSGRALWFTEELGNRVAKITTGAPPSISIAFGAPSVFVKGSTTLTYTLRNPNTLTHLTHVSFTDVLPAGVFPVPGSAAACGNVAIASEAKAVSFSEGALAPGGSCSFSVIVTGIVPGTWSDTTGEVSSLEGGAGTPASATLVVLPGQPPAVTSAAAASFAVGVEGRFAVTATGDPVPALAVLGDLPAGLSFQDSRNGTGALFGTPAAGAAGSYSVKITAKNGVEPYATQEFALSVVAPAGNTLEITIEPSRPTANDDLVVRALVPGGCRLLESPFRQTGPLAFSGLVFATAEPDGCPSGDVPLEARLPLPVTGPGTYRVSLWKITGGSAPTPDTPGTKAVADFNIGDAEWLIPAVARADGFGGARWTTDLEIFGTGPAEAVVKLTLLASGGGPSPQAAVVVPPQGVVRIEDLVRTSFGLDEGTGALLLTSSSLALRFVPTIGVSTGGGRIAQALPVVPARGRLRTGRSGVLVGIEEDEAARTNLALANTGEGPADVVITLEADGARPAASARSRCPPEE